jgi:hypothetical protein
MFFMMNILDKMESIPALIVSGTFGVLAAVLATYVSARRAIKYLYESRLLERKEKAYIELIEAFHDVIDPLQIWLELAESQREASHPDELVFRAKYREGLRKIRKATDIGAFYFPANVMAVLDRLRKGEMKDPTSGEVSVYEYYDEQLAVHRKALGEIIEIARGETSGELA